MNNFQTAHMLQLKQVLANARALDTIKKPVSVTPAASDYYEHIQADTVLIGTRNNTINTLVSTALTEYNSLQTRRVKHMFKALKEPIRMDTLVDAGYKYLVVKVPNYIKTNEYNNYKEDLNNIVLAGCHGVTMWMSGIASNGKPDYSRTNPTVIADEYFGAGLSFASLNPFNVASVIDKPLDKDTGSHAKSGVKYNLKYFYQAIDMDYAVNELDCVMLSVSTIGFSGDFYYNDTDYTNGNTSTYSAEAPENITYYYM